jgi:hypothetical protein
MKGKKKKDEVIEDGQTNAKLGVVESPLCLLKLFILRLAKPFILPLVLVQPLSLCSLEEPSLMAKN